LLPAFFEPGRVGRDYARKPIFSREGGNVQIMQN